MRPAFALYAEYLKGMAPAELARKFGIPMERVVWRIEAARRCVTGGGPLAPAEAWLRPAAPA
jgi:hypothetical protein